jgi:hypothetical protein
MKLPQIKIKQTIIPKPGIGRTNKQPSPTIIKTTINTIQTKIIAKNINKAQQPPIKSKFFSEKLIAGVDGAFKFSPSSFPNSLNSCLILFVKAGYAP